MEKDLRRLPMQVPMLLQAMKVQLHSIKLNSKKNSEISDLIVTNRNTHLTFFYNTQNISVD
jgi:hypothetical protein